MDGEKPRHGAKNAMDKILSGVPSSEMYYRSYMHKEKIQFVGASNASNFFVTMSIDGCVKFWHKTENDIEFVKTINSRDGSFHSFSISHDGRFLATGSRSGKISIFTIESPDLVAKADFETSFPATVAFVCDPSSPLSQLAVTFANSSSIMIVDVLSGTEKPTILKQLDGIHQAPITCMQFLPACGCMLSCDSEGLIEFWNPDGSEATFDYQSKFDTDLFTLAGASLKALSCAATGKYVALCCSDWCIRVFDVASGKIIRAIADDATSNATYGLNKEEHDARIVTETSLRENNSFYSCCFDDSGNILAVPSPFGLKFISMHTGAVMRIIGRVEKQQRFNSVALLHSKSPFAALTAWDNQRIFFFSNVPPESARRDVFNEKESEEKVSQNRQKQAKPTSAKWPKIATLHTTMGSIKFEMFADECPLAVENFVTLARRGYFDNIRIHRVVRDFCIQTGDPTGKGYGGESIWGAPFEDEFPADGHVFSEPGMVGMANSGPNTNASQFFITTAATPHLTNKHTCWGRVVSGMDNIHKIEQVPVDNYKHPITEIKLVNITFN